MRRAAVLGHPISHSLSSVIHRTAYELLGLPWSYDRIDVTTDQLSEWVLSRTSEWVGVSLTMPLKSDILPLLDVQDELVTATGAANTVIFNENSRVGFNTDVQGMVNAISEIGLQSVGSVLIVGGGATARSALAASGQLGANKVDVLARRPEACAGLHVTGEALGIEPNILSWTSDRVDLSYDLVVSTVPAGVADALVDSIPDHPRALLDVVYQSWPTPFASVWQARGGRAASGLEMLLYQGIEQISLMTGEHVSAERIRPALEAAATQR